MKSESPTPTEVPKAVDAEKMNNLTFSEAIAHLIKGERVTKQEWKNSAIFAAVTDGMLKLYNPKAANWAVSEADMLGDDFIVLGE